MDLKPDLRRRRSDRARRRSPRRRARFAPSAKASIDLRAIRADATWQASSFDLAQGLDVKVMQSKLSPETLDRLFRG